MEAGGQDEPGQTLPRSVSHRLWVRALCFELSTNYYYYHYVDIDLLTIIVIPIGFNFDFTYKCFIVGNYTIQKILEIEINDCLFLILLLRIAIYSQMPAMFAYYEKYIIKAQSHS